MRPLNYAMLKYFTTVDEASVDDVMDALKGDYSDFIAFKRDKMQEALMTAEKNGLIGESRVDLDDNGELRVFYTATPEQRDTINSYIK
jgi:DNA-binding PadR family transcriptional regulator